MIHGSWIQSTVACACLHYSEMKKKLQGLLVTALSVPNLKSVACHLETGQTNVPAAGTLPSRLTELPLLLKHSHCELQCLGRECLWSTDKRAFGSARKAKIGFLPYCKVIFLAFLSNSSTMGYMLQLFEYWTLAKQSCKDSPHSQNVCFVSKE